MRADRLLSILLLIQNHGKITSRQLAEKLEVSERTICRDMEALSAAGVPVFAERGSNGGWCLSEGYRTTLTGMKTGEILSLLLSNPSNLLDDLGIRNDFEVAFQKLLAESPVTIQQDADIVRQRIHIDGAGWHQSNESFPYLTTVQEAVWKTQKLYIQYQREKDIVERIVNPLGLVAKRSIWYVVAEIEGEFRTYRVSRLVDARIVEESFERPHNFNLAQYWEQSTEQFKMSLPRYSARVRMIETVLPRFASQPYARVNHIRSTKNGLLDADIEFETLDSACQIILSFGACLEVLAPNELRNKVKAEAKAIELLYEGK